MRTPQDLLKQYESIKDPVAKVKFIRENYREILRANFVLKGTPGVLVDSTLSNTDRPTGKRKQTPLLRSVVAVRGHHSQWCAPPTAALFATKSNKETNAPLLGPLDTLEQQFSKLWSACNSASDRSAVNKWPSLSQKVASLKMRLGVELSPDDRLAFHGRYGRQPQ
jgi:hypothetical protein